MNLNSKRVILPSVLSTDGISETAGPLKKMRSCNPEEKLVGECKAITQLLGPPFAVLAQTIHIIGSNLLCQQHGNDMKEALIENQLDQYATDVDQSVEMALLNFSQGANKDKARIERQSPLRQSQRRSSGKKSTA
ncbi:hypothetical protein ACH5RR_029145 [Cinchona calisaya]|uniref:Uncharacterized protein n=1 Tax=Cinchona calisaya TaxID=153742 RepID=A0ABD2YQT5_9GENT